MKLCSRIFVALLLVVFMGFCSGCSDDSSPTPYKTDSVDNPDTLTSDQDEEQQEEEQQEEVPNVPASVVFDTPNPQIIIVEQTSTVSVTVTNSSGAPVEPGTDVIFSLVDSQYGSLETVTAVTNAVGVATTTFLAATVVGEAIVKASSGGISSSTHATITISGSAVATIQFVETSVYVIAIKESGGNSIANVSFMVKDKNNNPVEGHNVEFFLSGPNGGEYIGEDLTSPNASSGSTLKTGIASVMLHSGYVAGTSTITARIWSDAENGYISIDSPSVAIGGGVPSQKRFFVTTPILNVPGLFVQNHEFTTTAFIADRFGNYNVLDGLAVSFSSEMGLAVDSTMVSANGVGAATVGIRTHQMPEDVDPDEDELDLLDALNADYFDGDQGLSPISVENFNNPRDGLVKVLAYTKGEEHFVDKNANGLYDGVDSRDIFVDTPDDPFCDFNDSGWHTDDPEDILTALIGLPDEYELYIDADNNGVYDAGNDLWDEEKYIFASCDVLTTGRPMIVFKDSSFSVSSSNDNIEFIVCDRNFNPLVAGTEIVVGTSTESSTGILDGDTDIKVVDTNDPTDSIDDIEYSVYFQNMSVGRSEIFVKVTWMGVEYNSRLGGEIIEPPPAP